MSERPIEGAARVCGDVNKFHSCFPNCPLNARHCCKSYLVHWKLVPFWESVRLMPHPSFSCLGETSLVIVRVLLLLHRTRHHRVPFWEHITSRFALTKVAELQNELRLSWRATGKTGTWDSMAAPKPLVCGQAAHTAARRRKIKRLQ